MKHNPKKIIADFIRLMVDEMTEFVNSDGDGNQRTDYEKVEKEREELITAIREEADKIWPPQFMI